MVEMPDDRSIEASSETPSTRPDGPAIVFVGPCLADMPAHRQQRLLQGFEVWGPVARGDVLGALCLRPRLLLILDGFYYTKPSIPHKELLYALESGVQVLGAASMGALRAAELAKLGMVGIGHIFESYRDGHIDGDDEVAMLHGSADDDYRAVTLASVEVRFALSRLEQRGWLEPDASNALIEDLRGVSFDRRTPELLAQLAETHLPPEAAERLPRLLRRCRLKRRDAVLALSEARRRMLSPATSSPPSTRHASTLYFDYFRLWGLSLPLDLSLSDLTLHRAAYLALALLPAAPVWVRAWRRRFCLAWWAREQGAVPPEDDFNTGVEALRREYPAACEVLPDLELQQEARQRWLASWAEERVSETRTFADLGLPHPEDEGPLGSQLHGILPPWDLVRSFAFTPWLKPALDVAQVVFPMARRFAQWSQGSKVSQGQLRQTASELWQCRPTDVEAEGLRRGLPLGDGFAEGLWNILEAWLLTDRLRPAPMGYDDALRRLFETELPEET